MTMQGDEPGWDPWQVVDQMADVTVRVGDPGPGAWGRVDFASRTVTLAPDLLDREERCTLSHELVHLERGPVPPWQQDREEQLVEAESARRMVPLRDLMTAVQWTDDAYELALELWVDVTTLVARVKALIADHRRILDQAATDRDGGAA